MVINGFCPTSVVTGAVRWRPMGRIASKRNVEHCVGDVKRVVVVEEKKLLEEGGCGKHGHSLSSWFLNVLSSLSASR